MTAGRVCTRLRKITTSRYGAQSEVRTSSGHVGLPGKPKAVRVAPDSNLPCREISRYGGREIPARATFDA